MTEVSPPRLAATVLLLRDGEGGPEVLMVVRHEAMTFASGALVFPGGRVEANDRSIAAATGAADPDSASIQIAAIRETFEECGILLARPAGTEHLVNAGRLTEIDARHRAALCRGERSFADVLSAERLGPAPDMLVPFAHWITPAGRPKRFDTHFFLAAAPPEQVAAHDGSESVNSVWIRPGDAIEQTSEGRWKLVFATRLNLIRLASYASVSELMARARATSVVTVEPRMERGPNGVYFRIPAEAGYGNEVFPAVDPPA